MSDGALVRSTSSTFEQSCSVVTEIRAPIERVWALLTDAGGFAAWNSTVTELEGPIAIGQKLRITVPYSTRTFTPKVTQLDEPTAMTWSDGQAPFFRGVRTFALREVGEGTVEFSMTETLKGVMLPMARRSLPDFDPIFRDYADDLQAAAESTAGGEDS